MTSKELAAILNGKTECEITKSIEKNAKENGLVIVYGASDDLMEFRGAIYDEGNCYGGGIVKFTKKGVIQNEEECSEAIELLKENGYNVDGLNTFVNEIKSIWCEHTDEYPNLSWSYETDTPHETFELMEYGDVYCIGIVFNLSDLK